MNFAIIGTNFISDWFMSAGSHCEGFHVQAVYSRTMEKGKAFAAKYGIPDTYDDLDALAAADNVDAVYIASPTYCHCEHSLRMMNGGKHVLCEKPIASNVDELYRMLETAEKNHVVIMEAMKSAFDPVFALAKELMPRIGKVRRATLTYCQYSSRYDKFKNGIIENAFRPELSNGSIMDICCYVAHPLVKLFGRPDEIIAAGVNLENGINGMGTILAIYKEQGMIGELRHSKITDAALPTEIQGEAGTMVIEEIFIPNKIKIRFRDKHWEEFSVPKADPGNNMNYEVAEFIRLVSAGESAKEHNQYSIWEMEILDEARRQMGVVFPADL